MTLAVRRMLIDAAGDYEATSAVLDDHETAGRPSKGRLHMWLNLSMSRGMAEELLGLLVAEDAAEVLSIAVVTRSKSEARGLE
jgi:hypothetical protein